MDVKEIGNRIKQARVLRNCTLDDIANDIGVAKSTIQRYENGFISKPKLPILQTIADSLRVNPTWICGQDVPMISDDSLEGVLKRRLDEIGMTLEEVAEKSVVSLYWLQNIDTFTPGEFGDYEIGYDWITKVAEVIGLPGGELRAALARQEIPTYDGPPSDAKMDFEQVSQIEKNTASEKNLITSFRKLSEVGKEKVIDYANDLTENPKYSIMESTPDHLLLNAAHERTDIEITDEMRKHDDDIMDDENF